MNFEQAYKRLKEINDTLKSEDVIDVTKIVELQKEAKELYDFCKNEIQKIEDYK